MSMPDLRALLSPRRPLLLGFGLVFLFETLVLLRGNPDGLAQPIAFNHAKHLASGMACTDCHAGAREAARATLPNLATCMNCHETPLTQSSEEAKIRALAAQGKEAAWTRITRLPAHVYFSHRRHATLAGLDCAVCHGPMEKAAAPPRRPFRQMTMDACIQCHQQKGARTDCNDCHR